MAVVCLLRPAKQTLTDRPYTHGCTSASLVLQRIAARSLCTHAWLVPSRQLIYVRHFRILQTEFGYAYYGSQRGRQVFDFFGRVETG
jgi:hypothetical protein